MTELGVTELGVTEGTEAAAETTAEMKTIAEAVRKLAQLVAEHGLSELTVEDAGVTLTVKAAVPAAPVPGAMAGSVTVPAHPHLLAPAQSPAYSETAVLTPPKSAPAKSTAIALESPMVGVFYRSASPNDPPFVSIGDFVKVGQPIGLIEAMKVYSEVPSEVSGRVTEMPVESGKLVQQGQPLIFVEP